MLARPTALALLHRLQQGLSNPPAELIHVPHTHWPLPAQWQHHTTTPYPKSRPLRISVLDASFNPPTLAHLALANAPRPNLTRLNCEGKYEDEDQDQSLKNNYDATLLLLSVRNADKSLKPSDATYLQRLEMMDLLAHHIQPTDPRDSANVAVAIIDEPTFVGKSSCLLQFLNRRLATTNPDFAADVHLQLYFILGIDTLERLVAPRYYPSESAMLTSLRHFLSPSADNSIVVCARRKSSNSIPLDTGNRLGPAEEFVESKRIVMIDIGNEESTYSSTAVRTAIQQLGLGEEAQKQWGRFVPANVAAYIVHEKLYVSPI